MLQQELESWLVESLSDFSLSQSEALALRELLPGIKEDQIAYVRNKAFLLIRDLVRDGGDTAVAGLLWLEKVIKTIDQHRSREKAAISEAHFSPGENCRRQLVDLLSAAKHSADICVFTISDDRLSNAVIAAHQRGVAVRVITDNEKSLDVGSDIQQLEGAGIAVKMDRSASHMHHKFALIDRRILVNGSFNWTRSASDYNQENILVTDDHDLVAAYTKEFDDLWKEFT